MKFLLDGKFTTLQWEHNLGPTHAQLHHIQRMISTKAIVEIYSMQVIEENSVTFPLPDLPADIEPELALLLHSYGEVLSTPSSLPPQRSHDHSIPLIEGS